MSEPCQAQSAAKQRATYNQLLRHAVHRINNSSLPLPLLSTILLSTLFTNIDDDDFSVPRSDKAVVSAKSAGTPGPRPHTKVHARVEELPFRYASRCRHARGSVEMYGRRRRDSIGAGSSVQAAQLVVARLVRGGPLQR